MLSVHPHANPLTSLRSTCIFAMGPKKFSQSAITRLSQADLLSACEDWGIQTPKGALDLELRALLARAIVGGTPVIPTDDTIKPPLQDGKAADAGAVEQNPFEEFEQPTADQKPKEPQNLG